MHLKPSSLLLFVVAIVAGVVVGAVVRGAVVGKHRVLSLHLELVNALLHYCLILLPLQKERWINYIGVCVEGQTLLINLYVLTWRQSEGLVAFSLIVADCSLTKDLRNSIRGKSFLVIPC